MLSIILSTALFSSLALAQSLGDATNAYDQLSQFRNLIATYPSLVPKTNASSQFTVLIPNDKAFSDYEAATGHTVASLGLDVLTNHFQYHTIDGGLDLQQQSNILANTELTADIYNHRNGTEGQVVFVSQATKNNTHAVVKSGAGYKVDMNVINGAFQGGKFQIVDGFLTLPKTCTDTMNDASNKYTALYDALVKTNLTDTLNNFPNVTCLAPNNGAFKSAGSPQVTLNVSDLTQALLYHTLPGAMYSTVLTDGDIFQAANGGTVQVHVKDNGTVFFNDAMVVNLNVITNNGVIHVLDRVMSVINATSSATSSTATSTSTATSSGTASSTSSSASTSATANAAAGRTFGSTYLPAMMAVAVLAI